MKRDLVARVLLSSIFPLRRMDALVDPEMIRQYMFKHLRVTP